MHYKEWCWCGNFYVLDLEFLLVLVYDYKVLTQETHHVTSSLIWIQRLSTFFFFFFFYTCPISCSLVLFLYHRDFFISTHPNKMQVIQTAEVTSSLRRSRLEMKPDVHVTFPPTLYPSGSHHCCFPHTARQAQSSTFRKNCFSSCF